MSFDERYQLLELAEDVGVKTFIAREISTGQKVSVFLFVGEQAHVHADLLAHLRAVDRTLLPELIEDGDNRGTPYIVTRPLAGFSELEDRLAHLSTSQQSTPEHGPGEFSKVGIWRVPPSLQSTPEQTEKESAESATAGKQQPQPAAVPSASGSFTQMFQAPAAPIGEPVPEAPKPPPTPIPTPPKQAPAPGSFTQMFQAPAAPIGESKPEIPRTPTPAKSGPGEFTRFFNAPAAPATPAPLPTKPEAPGEFERIFGSGDRVTSPPSTVTGIFNQSSPTPAPKYEPAGSPSASAPPPAFTPPASEFTRIFGETSMEIPTLGPIAAPKTPAAPPPAPSAPGEYTRMFNAPPPTPEPTTAPVPAPIRTPEASAPARQTSKMVPVLIGIILLLLAAIAVIVVTMRK